jgi:hypothetical protein
MANRNEVSSLVALRELRDMERRRLGQEAEAEARAERHRREQEQARMRADEERLARERAAGEAVLAAEAAEAARLRRELAGAQCEIVRLREQLDCTERARAELATERSAPATNTARPSTLPWLGLTAGATMLVGALALAAATRPQQHPAAWAEPPGKSTAICPEPVRSPPPPTAVPQLPSAQPSPAKPSPRPHGSLAGRPRGNGKQTSAAICDGTDPLCGIPLDHIDDVGKRPAKGDKRNSRQ